MTHIRLQGGLVLESGLEHRKSVAKLSVHTTSRGTLVVLSKSTLQAVGTVAASHGCVDSAILVPYYDEKLQLAQHT